MSETTFIDTQFVVALINQRDQHHAHASAWANHCRGRRFLITDVVLVEIGNALSKNYRQQAAEVIDHFLSSDDVEVVRLTPVLFDESFSFYRSHQDKEWGLTDCISFVVMRQAGVRQALTFDQHFTQAGFQALLRDAVE